MSLLGLLLVLLVLFFLLGGWGHSHGWGYYGWSPLLVVFVVIVLLWALGGLTHASALPLGAAGIVLLLGVVNPTPVPPSQADVPPAGPPGLPYAVSYWLGNALYIYFAFAAYVTAQYMSGNGASLPWGLGSPQEFAVVSLFSVLLGALGRLFPNVQHTPAFRTRELLHARTGRLPRDLHRLEVGGEPRKLAGDPQ